MAAAPDELHEIPSPMPAPPELIERANTLVREFPECFWYRHPQAPIEHLEDVRLVAARLVGCSGTAQMPLTPLQKDLLTILALRGCWPVIRGLG